MTIVLFFYVSISSSLILVITQEKFFSDLQFKIDLFLNKNYVIFLYFQLFFIFKTFIYNQNKYHILQSRKVTRTRQKKICAIFFAVNL
jgi:hypothetical protein